MQEEVELKIKFITQQIFNLGLTLLLLALLAAPVVWLWIKIVGAGC